MERALTEKLQDRKEQLKGTPIQRLLCFDTSSLLITSRTNLSKEKKYL